MIKISYTFIDYEKNNSRKEDKLSAFYDLIKKGIISVEQAANTIGITKEQLLEGFNEYNLVL